jgi:hypothetical protein
MTALRRPTDWLRLAASAVLAALAVAGCSSGGSGAAGPAAADSAGTASSAASPRQLPGEGHAPVAIPAGTYTAAVNGHQASQPTPVIDVPAGFTGSGFAVSAGLGDQDTAVASDARGLSFWGVQGVYTNPCGAGKSPVDPGPSVADLARALSAQPLRAGSDPTPVNVAGYRGMYVETSVPAAIDFATCQDGYFDSWTSSGGGGRFQQGPGQQDRLWILDVDGYRLVIDGWHMPGATPQQVDQISQMVKTLAFRRGW